MPDIVTLLADAAVRISGLQCELAGSGTQEAGDRADECCFPRTIGACQDECLAGRHDERKSGKDRSLAAVYGQVLRDELHLHEDFS